MQHAGRTQRRIVSAWIGTAFAEADQLRPRVSKLAELMDGAADDVLACMGCPAAQRASSTTPLERVNSLPPDLIRGARSSAAPTWSAASPTKPPLSGASARGCSNRTTSAP